MVSIHAAEPAHLESIVQLHIAAFPNFFMTRLGPAFLREYYRTILDYERGIALLAVSAAGEVDGFVTGFVEPSAFYRRLRSRRWRLVAASLPALLRTPMLSWRLLQHRQQVSRACCEQSAICESELSSIGVSPTARAAGIGRALVQSFLARASEMGADCVTLTTDADDNDKVNRFYRSLEFDLTETFDANGGRRMHRYRLTLPPHRHKQAA